MSPRDENQCLPSASERARDQVARYEASDGVGGGELDARPVANPEAEIRHRARRIAVRAREVHGQEEARLWADADNPAYAAYRERVERQIPVLLLEPRDA